MLKKIIAIAAALMATTAMAAVEVNKASEAELDSIKGVGPATSRVILAERKKADFKNWQDLMVRVKGIGDARATKLSEQGLTVAGKGYEPIPTAVKAKDHRTTNKESASGKDPAKAH